MSRAGTVQKWPSQSARVSGPSAGCMVLTGGRDDGECGCGWSGSGSGSPRRVAPKSTVAFFPFLAAPFLLTQLPLGAPLLLLLWTTSLSHLLQQPTTLPFPRLDDNQKTARVTPLFASSHRPPAYRRLFYEQLVLLQLHLLHPLQLLRPLPRPLDFCSAQVSPIWLASRGRSGACPRLQQHDHHNNH